MSDKPEYCDYPTGDCLLGEELDRLREENKDLWKQANDWLTRYNQLQDKYEPVLALGENEDALINVSAREFEKLRKEHAMMKECLEIYAAHELYEPYYGMPINVETAKLLHGLGKEARECLAKLGE